jgi:error-prone DNA polymerase
MTTHYAELYCLSNFSFLRSASHPEELVAQAAALGYSALAITDACSVAGVVRAHLAAREHGLKLIVGSEIALTDGPRLVLLAPHRRAYGQLCALISLGRGNAPKGSYRLSRSDLAHAVPDCLALLVPTYEPSTEELTWFRERFGGRGRG